MTLFPHSLQNAYIGEYKLNLVFDFSIDTWFWSYTYTNTWWNWLTIQNNNWWVTNNWSHWNWFVWKTVNAKKVWTRVLWNMANVSISWDNGWWLWLWVFAGNGGIPSNSWYNTEQQCYNSSKTLRLNVKGTRVALETFNVDLWTDYYMDFKFENWVYTCEILDTNLNVLKTETYTSTDTTCNYVWFTMWNYWQTNFCRIKKYWEYYVE